MKKTLLFSMLTAGALFTALAQETPAKFAGSFDKNNHAPSRFSLLVGANPGIQRNNQNATLGGDFGLSYTLLKGADIFVAAGLSHFFSPAYSSSVVTANTITQYDYSGMQNLSSLRGGLKLTPWKLYVSAEAGVGFGQNGAINSNLQTYNPAVPVNSASSTLPAARQRSFIYAPSAGFRMTNGFEIGLRYEGTTSTIVPDQYALHFGYQLRLKK